MRTRSGGDGDDDGEEEEEIADVEPAWFVEDDFSGKTKRRRQRHFSFRSAFRRSAWDTYPPSPRCRRSMWARSLGSLIFHRTVRFAATGK